MLVVISQVMEKIVVSMWILPNLYLRQPSQFTYVPVSGRGAASVLTLVSHHILNFLDAKSRAARVIAADFSKDFS